MDNLDETIVMMKRKQQEFDIDDQNAANTFAEVVNAMFTNLVDAALLKLDSKDSEESTIDAVNKISNLASGSGYLFDQFFKTVKIDPVAYNGKAKQKNLENLYLKYAKLTSGGEGLLKMALGGDVTGGNTDANSANMEDSMKKMEQDQIRLEALGKVLGFSQSKVSGLQQRLFKDLIMSGLGGDGGGLGQIADLIKGKRFRKRMKII
jgi:hypothetical protein